MHIVIISGGTILPPFLEKRMKEEEWNFVIAVDRGLETCFALQIVPDMMIGDFDSVSQKVFMHYQELQVPIHTYPSRKDDTDTALALHAALQHKPDQITVYGATGSRIDHMLANISLLQLGLENKVPIILMDTNNRIRLIDDCCIIPKATQFGKYVSFLPMTNQVDGVTLTGFRYPMNDGMFIQGNSLGVSNQIEEDEASISVKNGILIMIESID